MWKKSAGFTLMELLVVMATMSIVMAGMVGAFSAHNHTQIEQDLGLELEQNLRMAMSMVTDTLRTAGYGVPKTNLATWLPGSGFTTAPVVFSGSPATLAVANCTAQAVATLSNQYPTGQTNHPAGTTTLPLDAADLLSTNDLIWINNTDYALVKSIADETITIDTNPTQTNNQGTTRPYLAGTPLCRVDVQTFDIDSGALVLDRSDDNGPQPAAQDISDLQVDGSVAGRYQITLTAQAEIEGKTVTRSLSADVALRN